MESSHAAILAQEPLATNGERGGPPLRQLSVADLPFASSGVAKVRVTKRGTIQTLEIPIKSVEFEVVEALVASERPRVPRRRENIPGQGWKYISDEMDNDYVLAVANYNRKLSYAAVLMALDLDVCDAHGTVVWSADNSIMRYDEARNALKQMGLVENQFLQILEAVRQLTRDDEEQSGQD